MFNNECRQCPDDKTRATRDPANGPNTECGTPCDDFNECYAREIDRPNGTSYFVNNVTKGENFFCKKNSGDFGESEKPGTCTPCNEYSLTDGYKSLVLTDDDADSDFLIPARKN